MDAYAVIKTGGKQYLVETGTTLDVEKINGDVGAKVDLSNVLAVSDGKSLNVGKPYVAGGKVIAEIVKQFLADKVVSFKKKRRKGYSRKKGHRQELTKVKIVSL